MPNPKTTSRNTSPSTAWSYKSKRPQGRQREDGLPALKMTGHTEETLMVKVFIEGRRDGYSPEQCGKTMTVGELIAYLENFDEDAKIYLENDGGYTYGYIIKGSFREVEDEDEEDDDE